MTVVEIIPYILIMIELKHMYVFWGWGGTLGPQSELKP